MNYYAVDVTAIQVEYELEHVEASRLRVHREIVSVVYVIFD